MCSIRNNFCFLNNVQKVEKELNDTNMDQTSRKSPKIKVNNARKSDDLKKSRKSVNNKRRQVQKLTFSSTDSSEEEQNASPRKVSLRLIETKMKPILLFIFNREILLYLFHTAGALFADKQKYRSRITICHEAYDIKETAKGRNIFK